MKVVGVVDRIYDRAPEVFDAATVSGLRCLRAPGDEADLAAFVKREGVAHVIISLHPYRGPLYDTLPAGGVIARFGVGYDNIDRVRAAGRGLYCTNTPGCLAGTVAEHALALLLAAARGLPALDAAVHQGRWLPVTGTTLEGRTLVIVGCGQIGCRVAGAAARGLGMRVIGVTGRPADAEALRAKHGFAELATDFAAVAPEADFISLHVPGRPALAHYVNAERLALMKSGAWLINTARGSVVDEAALYDALRAGRLGGAALDVFEHEPYRPVQADKDLRTLENVIMTPHTASNTRETNIAMARRALANIVAAEAGKREAMDLI